MWMTYFPSLKLPTNSHSPKQVNKLLCTDSVRSRKRTPQKVAKSYFRRPKPLRWSKILLLFTFPPENIAMNHCHQYLDSFLVDIILESQFMFKVVIRLLKSVHVLLSILLTLQRCSLESRINEVFKGLFRFLSKIYEEFFCENGYRFIDEWYGSEYASGLIVYISAAQNCPKLLINTIDQCVKCIQRRCRSFVFIAGFGRILIYHKMVSFLALNLVEFW